MTKLKTSPGSAETLFAQLELELGYFVSLETFRVDRSPLAVLNFAVPVAAATDGIKLERTIAPKAKIVILFNLFFILLFLFTYL